MVSVNVELIGSLLAILVILVSAIVAIVNIYNGASKSISKLAYSVDSINDKIDRFETYDQRITKNEKDIVVEKQERRKDVALINQRCAINHKED